MIKSNKYIQGCLALKLGRGLVAALLPFALGTTLLRAEDPKPAPASTPPPGERPRSERPAFWQGEKGLTEEQRQAVREAQRAFREESRPHSEQLRTVRRKLDELAF